MKRFHVTRRARRDLLEIWNAIAADGGAPTADRVIAAMYDAIQLIAKYPKAGHRRSDVDNARYRFWGVYRFVIAYRTDRKPLTIARVLHGARNLKRLFR